MPTATPPKILLLIPHLGGGGAEQVMTLLARELSHQKYELHLGLITQEKRGEEALPPWVTVHALGAARVRSGLLPLLHLVRQLKPEVILSGMAHLNFLVLLLRPFFPRGTQVLVRQNATVSAALSFGDLPFYTRFLYRRLYRHADRIICQTRAMADDLAFELGVARERIVVLANPVDLEGILAAERDPVRWCGEGPHLLAIGRLSREKGFDLLLESLSAVQHRFPSADLTILGAGPEEQALKELSRTLGLEAVVRFAGQVERPYGFFPGATLLVLSSRHEGMPNVLLEAAAAGLPMVALPASGGVRELLEGRPGAWLAEEISASALTEALLRALESLKPGERFHLPSSPLNQESIETSVEVHG